ncbi:MAG: undecaprenyldiphospho-muramoylpentapeptide beta-N-acetylglucosaminyltransferase [Candidatus Obscuribacterales bacterium]|nr:undecaprenyldiphospho-muramoylpentapeptide beta-N-acetylglucosaminyltransferase [Candidatus Obscuribacterales bacterium]
MVRHRLVLTGGGTGGHIYPALAMAEQLKDDSDLEAILYIGAKGHLEERLCRARGLDFIGLDVSGMPRKLSGKLLAWPFQLLAAVVEVRKALLEFRPTVVLGTGGYASAPALIAASLLHIPFAIHEPDAHPGLVNRLLARQASLVSCGMHGAYDTLKPKRGKIVVNGNPVGKSFLNPLKRDAACAVLGLRSDLKTILITGGSQGARAINEAVMSILPELLDVEPPVQIIHQVGEKNIYECKERIDQISLNNSRYFLRDYFDDLSVPYAVADLTICRAGAMTISELSVMGTPAVFVPFPFAAADHQTHNAKYMSSKGAAITIVQSAQLAEDLKRELLKLLSDDERIRSMHKAMLAEGKPRAAMDLASQLKEISTAHQIRQNKEGVHQQG